MSSSAEIHQGSEAHRRETVRETDLRFQLAMLQAIKRGYESASIGIVRDKTPMMQRCVFHPEPTRSGCSSSAALCAEEGDKHMRVF